MNDDWCDGFLTAWHVMARLLEKARDDEWCDGFIRAWNCKPYPKPRKCVACQWYAGDGLCAKRGHRACPDWEPFDD